MQKRLQSAFKHEVRNAMVVRAEPLQIFRIVVRVVAVPVVKLQNLGIFAVAALLAGHCRNRSRVDLSGASRSRMVTIPASRGAILSPSTEHSGDFKCAAALNARERDSEILSLPLGSTRHRAKVLPSNLTAVSLDIDPTLSACDGETHAPRNDFYQEPPVSRTAFNGAKARGRTAGPLAKLFTTPFAGRCRTLPKFRLLLVGGPTLGAAKHSVVGGLLEGGMARCAC